MDFADSPEHAEFRREFRAWLDANLPDDLKVEDAQDQRVSPDRETLEKRIAWQKKMLAAGWVGLSWPKEYGGRGASFMQQVILDEEYFRARAPILPGTVGMSLLGPTLIHWGTEEQKKRYLPKILSCDEIWCQGYSEPGAGSDLAGVQTRAVPTEGGWLVNGQKVWTTLAHRSEFGILLAGTDPCAGKHEGLSMLVVDLRSPGVVVRPIHQLDGARHFDEVLASPGAGWRVASAMLHHQRAARATGQRRGVRHDRTDRLVAELQRQGRSEPALRDDLVRLYMAEVCQSLLVTRTVTASAEGTDPGPVGTFSA